MRLTLPPEQTLAPCQPWCAPPDPENPETSNPAWCCRDVDLSDPEVYERVSWAATVASSILFRLSGYRFNGICSATEYLCVRTAPCGCPTLGCGDDWRSYPRPSGDASTWVNETCPCGPTCDCRTRARVALPSAPVVGVESVTLNGQPLDPSTYTVVDGRWLYLRNLTLDALAAACFDPFTTPEPSGLAVTWSWGQQPPPDGVNAACVLACELYKGRCGQACQLPRRVQVAARQGLQFAVLDPMDFIPKGLTGIFEVDQFLGPYVTPQTTVTFVEDVQPLDFSERARSRW